MLALAVALTVLIGSAALLWVGSSRLEKASKQIGNLYGLPPVVQGSIVIAIGSSFPELASTLLATLLHDAFELGIGIIVGSAVMNVLIIPGIAVLGSDTMQTSRNLVFKEGLFYLAAVLALSLVFALSIVYNPLGGAGGLRGLFTRELAILPLVLYAMYLVLQWQDTRDHTPQPRQTVEAWRAWGGLVAGLLLVLVSAEGLIRSVLYLGNQVGVSPFVWGVIVIASATSLPDTFASMSAARNDRSLASLANVLGSNTFDVLVILPIGVMVAGSAVVDLARLGPLMLMLGASTLLFIAFMRSGFELTHREGWTLLASYAAFVAVVLYVEALIPFA